MKTMLSAAVLALALVLASGHRADAQVVTYGYSPYTGVYSQGNTWYGPGMVESSSAYYSPWTGTLGREYLYGNPYGSSYYQGTTYNPYIGYTYSQGTWPGRYRYYPGSGMYYSPRFGWRQR